MRISKQAQRDARVLLRSCLVQGRVDEGRVRALMDKVLARKPRGYLALVSHFQRLVKLHLERYSARVESAAPLEGEQENKLRALLEARYGGQLSFTFAVDPALIGGLRVRVGSDVYDGTVLGRLAALAESFQAE